MAKTLIGNFKGPVGPKGDKGQKGDQGPSGPQGGTGERGNRWNQGTKIDGEATVGTVYPESGITSALVGDNYLNTDTGNIYKCVTSGDNYTAKWVYTGCMKGPEGPEGLRGETGERGPAGGVSMDTKVTYTTPESYTAPGSGIAFDVWAGRVTRGLANLFSELAKKLDPGKILSTEEFEGKIEERGFLADAVDIKNKIKKDLDNHLMVRVKGITIPLTKEGGVVSGEEKEIAIEGWKALAVVGFGTGQSHFYPSDCYLKEGKVVYRLKNTDTVSRGGTLEAYILYAKA